ncbi:hypothetical protein RUM43_011798 [Polyplax serrata]|uniref:Uncharacterized protein n=1 Tax=Polyplax serrata TaxID=468196 RepID=A0AAN8P5W1_POLSC
MAFAETSTHNNSTRTTSLRVERPKPSGLRCFERRTSKSEEEEQGNGKEYERKGTRGGTGR